METLLRKSTIKIAAAPQKFKRYLFERINYKQSLIAIKGARGTGKTTLLLQIGKRFHKQKVLYVALDDLFFTSNTLYSLAERFYQLEGTLLLLDEVHKYPDWSREIKLIYDDFPKLKTIFTSSSILDIYKGNSDLSRRALAYELKALSFREYLALFKNIHFPTYTLNDILKNHREISLNIAQETKPLAQFQTFVKTGAFPYYLGNTDDYYRQILQTINLILEVDLTSVQNIDYKSVVKIKRLLYLLSLSVPFTPNISKLSEKVGLPRNTLTKVLHWLSEAHLIHICYNAGRSVSSLNKPDKIWLHNTNIAYALANHQPDTGNLRETFFLSQLSGLHEISIPKQGDFLIDKKYVFEIGGKNKTNKQIKTIENAFTVKDMIEVGVLNQIPLWLFGFMY